MRNMESSILELDDLYVGRTATHTVFLSEEIIRAFADLTGDHHPLHTDRAYAEASGFGDILAHGVLFTSIGSKLIGMDLPGRKSILVGQSSEYLKPAFPGDVLTFDAVVSNVRQSLAIVTVEIKVSNQHGEAVARVEYAVKIREGSE